MLAFVATGGEVREPARFAPIARQADLVLAVDAGYAHLRAMDMRPHLLLGDLDSISSEALADARAWGLEVKTYPAEKDYTDTELALRAAVEGGATCIIVVGAWGDRLDHSLANVLLLAAPAFADLDIRLLDERQEMRLVHGPGVRSRLNLRTQPGEIISLCAIGGEVEGVTTHGLYYPLSGATLQTGPALGVSNVAVGEAVEVEVASGSLLVTRIFAGGLEAERYLVDG